MNREYEHSDTNAAPVLVLARTSRDGVACVNVRMFQDPAVGTRLRVYRKRLRIGRDELAQRLSVDVDLIRRMEHEPWEVPIGLIAQACDELGISIYDTAEAEAVAL